MVTFLIPQITALQPLTEHARETTLELFSLKHIKQLLHNTTVSLILIAVKILPRKTS